MTRWVVLALAGCATAAVAQPPAPPAYVVAQDADIAVTIDGVMDEPAWHRARTLTDFMFPWQDRPAPDTMFVALADGQHLYFAFRVGDDDVVIGSGPGEMAVASGDRVELFFAADPKLLRYVCLEIAPDGRVLDYRAAFYREFDEDWDAVDLLVGTTLTGEGYIVEGRIPHATFRGAGLPTVLDAGGVLTGVFRAEFSSRPDAPPHREWISWVRPDSAEPDFHIPSAFGRLSVR